MASLAEHRVPAEIVIPIRHSFQGLNEKGELVVEISADVEHARIEVGGETIVTCSPSSS